MKANGDLPTAVSSTMQAASVNSIDYDFNIHAIKTLLMTTKVPESCVWKSFIKYQSITCVYVWFFLKKGEEEMR